MKRAIVIFLVVAAILFLIAPKVQEAILLFVLVGAIPGTSFSIPPLVMLGVTLAALFFVLHWAKKQEFYIRMHATHSVKSALSRPAAKKTPARRRRSNAKRRVARQAQTA